jgi:hypothetical protein
MSAVALGEVEPRLTGDGSPYQLHPEINNDDAFG